MISLLAILTVVVQAAVVAVALAWVAARLGWRSPWEAFARNVGPDAVRLAALVAVVATAGSLYFSQVRHFTPCELCWFQRVAMYPLALILPIAALRRDAAIAWYVLPQVLLGLVVSLYHVQLERFPDQEHISCSVQVPCTTIWFTELGYVTIPVMAATAFAAIAILLATGARHGTRITSQA